MGAPVRRRTRARELALQFLYGLELRGREAMDELASFARHHTRRGPDPRGREEVYEYTVRLVRGVQDHRDEINLWIERIAANWRLERMAHIDRNVLRMAVFELLFVREVPYKVVINEAIDVAKRYSTSQSGAFVNGILDRARVLIEEQRERGAEHPVPPDHAHGPAGPGRAPGDSLRPPPAPMPRPRARRPRQSGDAAAVRPAPPGGAAPAGADTPVAGEDFPVSGADFPPPESR